MCQPCGLFCPGARGSSWATEISLVTNGTNNQHFLHYSQILSFPDYKGYSPWCRQHLIANHYQTYAGYSLSCWQRWFNELVDLSLHYPNPPDGGRKPKGIWTPGHWAWHDINAGQFYGALSEEPGRRLHPVMQEWPLQKLRLWGRKRAMVVLTSEGSLRACPTLGKSMPEVMTFSSICHRTLSVTFHALSLLPVQSLELCHVGRRSPLHCENRFRISRSQHFPATGKNISCICSIHYFKKSKNERSLIPRIPFLQLLSF